jgi:hypothetical protein
MLLPELLNPLTQFLLQLRLTAGNQYSEELSRNPRNGNPEIGN